MLDELSYKIHATMKILEDLGYEAVVVSAQEFEMDYALRKKDYFWVKLRLRAHKKVLHDDPNLPDELRPVAQQIYEKFLQIEKEDPYRHYLI